MKGRKIRRFEGWISARLQAPYLSDPISPCQYETWQYTLPHCERGQITAAKHPIQNYDLFAQNVNGSQLYCERSEALWELLIEASSFVHWNCLYQVLCTINHNSIPVPKHTAHQQLRSELFGMHFQNGVVIEEETAGRRYVTCVGEVKMHTKFQMRNRKGRDQARDSGADGTTVHLLRYGLIVCRVSCASV